ncbi:hypothetical protein WD019_04610 [Fictibacillus sp. Mic-4]|uniref:hypothetical protein n=1 Tax=Fictibacillus sp. Mic-4 TaxID=3132826 RepID=UPI003CF51F12
MRGFNNINAYKDEQGEIVKIQLQKYTASYEKPELITSLDVVIGGEYVVKPENPLKLKHRDRIVTVHKFVEDHIGNPIKAAVKFKDNGRVGRVDVTDLAALEYKK